MPSQSNAFGRDNVPHKVHADKGYVYPRCWQAGFGKLYIRFERRLDTHVELLSFACAIICLSFFDHFCWRH
ncbi:hypothetical protein B0G80_1331 [Paraburkholderia sp. BL6669N2]|nr:hypothetical protein B0G80_1331 [Paraburkholderia sp. BL6669N2]